MFSFLLPVFLKAQATDNVRLPQFKFNSRAGEYDTAGFKNAAEVSKEATGVLEKEINPEEYILGPGDVVSVSIWAVTSTEIDAVISPEGKLLLPSIGAISLKNTTLADAEKIVRERVNKVFKTKEVVLSLKKLRSFKVTLLGAVRRPALVTATASDRISEVIDRAGGLLFNSSLRRITIERDGLKAPIEVDLQKFYSLGDKSANPTVLGGDRITIPYTYEKRSVSVVGEVALPGMFEFKEGDRLSAFVKFAQGFLPSALLDSVEIVRFNENNSEIERTYVDLSSWRDYVTLPVSIDNDIELRAGDRIFVRAIPDWQKPGTVAIKGEVQFPGSYAIGKNTERLKDIIALAGGFTQDADLENSILVRRQEWDIEDKEFGRLLSVPQKDMNEDELRYFKARAREYRGVIVVDFKNLDKGPTGDIILQDKDSVHIAPKKNYVNIIGRVNSPGRVLYHPNYTYNDYIVKAGGYGYRADKGNTVVIKPSSVQYPAGSGNYTIDPGDNILVPEEPETDYGVIFTTSLTVLAQLVTILAVVISLRANNTQ
ncbi:MAG: SLBB domain-containing protein [Bacteroidota bacterium]